MHTPITLLTLSHQYGSGGSLIARDLGQRLKWKVWDKEIVRAIASQQHVSESYVDTKDERVGSFIERLVEAVGVGGFERAYNVPPPLRLKDGQLARLTRQLMKTRRRWAAPSSSDGEATASSPTGSTPCTCSCSRRPRRVCGASCRWRS